VADKENKRARLWLLTLSGSETGSHAAHWKSTKPNGIHPGRA
jgi:hypothetical protein